MVASARFRSARRLLVAAAFLVSTVAYVASVSGSSVSVVDTTTNTVTATITGFQAPEGIAMVG